MSNNETLQYIIIGLSIIGLASLLIACHYYDKRLKKLAVEKELTYIYYDKNYQFFYKGHHLELKKDAGIETPFIFGGIDVLNNNRPKYWLIVPEVWDISSVRKQENNIVFIEDLRNKETKK